jgi:general secretion pathway protein D
MRAKLFSVVILSLFLPSCFAPKSYRLGERAEKAARYDEAINHYTRALAERPDNLAYQRALERAKLRGSHFHATEGARLAAAGNLEGAVAELRIAAALNPADSEIAGELARLETALKGGEAGRPSLESLKQQVRETPLGRLQLAPGAERPAGLLFREASLRDVLTALGKMAGVNVLFDSDFQDQSVSLELKQTAFEQALSSICAATRNFYRVQGDNILLIIPDTPNKRREYEQQLGKTFYLSSADLKETVDLLRIVLGARRIAPHSATNALTLIDTPEKIAAAERIISTIDNGRAELLVEMELFEVSRARLDQYGIQIRSASSQGLASAILPRDQTANQPFYSSANLVVTNLPGALIQLLRTDDDARLLASPQLRTTESQTAQAQFGERVPIPITTFTPLATGGVAQQPVTTFEYQNIGVNISVTPRLHHNEEVSLTLKIQIDNIAGTGFGDLPTFGNRSVDATLRLRNGETSLLAGLIRDEERTSLTGIPGLASIPVLGRIFASNRKEVQERDIVLTLTPRIVRQPELSVEDLRSFIIEGGAAGGFLYEAPVPLPRREPEREEARPPQPKF